MDPNGRGSEGTTSLIATTLPDQHGTVKALLPAGADPDAKLPTTGAAAVLAVAGQPGSVAWHLDAADPALRNAGSTTALNLARTNGQGKAAASLAGRLVTAQEQVRKAQPLLDTTDLSDRQ